MRLTNICLTITAALVLSGSAQAQIFQYSELEPNDTIETAQVIPPPFPHFGAVFIDGSITASDVDYFSLTPSAPFHITIVTLMTQPPGSSGMHDISLGWFDAAGQEIQVTHGLGAGASMFFSLTTPGAFYLGVSGFSDPAFSGLHSESFNYGITINFVPAPAGLPLLIGAAIGVRSRRRGTAHP